MKLSDVEWASLKDCAHSLASEPGALSEDSIKRWLMTRIAQGEIAIRYNGDPWEPEDLLTAVTGEYVNERYYNQCIDYARKNKDYEAERMWRAQKKSLSPDPPDFSPLTLDALPSHIVTGLELSTRDVLTKSTSKKGRRGVKEKYNWRAFDVAAIAILEDEGDFSGTWNQSALEVRMGKWCQDNWGDDHPAESTIRKHVQDAIRQFRMMRRKGR
jgi:hypothetical protein